MSGTGGRLLILDACVLIDFIREDNDILASAAGSLGVLIVPSPLVFDEIHEITCVTCAELGLSVVHPELDLLTKASIRSRGLSFYDRICLLMAEEMQATLYSNDKPLIAAASAAGVEARWGLELLLDLVSIGELTGKQAVEIAARICGRSCRYKNVLSVFMEELAKLL